MTKIQHTKNITKLFLLLLTMLFFTLPLSAQKLTVESMRLLSDDATARDEKYQRVDGNGNLAGLVKVQVALDDVKFDGGMLLDQKKWSASEYWVWMADGATKLTVVAPGFLPLEINFRDFDFKMLHSKNTYKLVVTVPTGVTQPQDDGMSYLVLKVEPSNARVVIDNDEEKARQPENGELMVLLSRGEHSYEVSANDYASQRGSVTIGKEKKEITVKLVSTMAQLKVECPTMGAQVYVNEKLKGTVPWTGSLGADTYRVEVRREGYRSQTQTVSLSKSDNRTISFSALTAITGNLNVAYSPSGSDVYIDGKKVGTTPDIFRNITVGSHKVEIRKNGYTSQTKTIEVRENQTAEVSGSLTPSSDGNIQTFTVKGVSFNMIRVEGGTMSIGNTEDQDSVSERGTFSQAKAAQKVTLSTFMIGETEVTQALWLAVMGPSTPHAVDNPNNPVDSVSWNECHEFVNKLNSLTGKKFRLPSEDEWEFAARGGIKSKHFKYSGSNQLNDVAWNEHNSDKKSHPVKTRKANELGIYDMSGNVWEWCEDVVERYGRQVVYRGGSFNPYSSGCQVSSRIFSDFDRTYKSNGFRLAL